MYQLDDSFWSEVRLKFPAASNGVYLNTAAVGPLANPVYDSYHSHILHMNRVGDWNYTRAIENMERTREKVAALMGAEACDIGFAPNTSHAMNLLAMMFKVSGSDNSISMPDIEFPSSLYPFRYHGYQLNLSPTINGRIDCDQLIKGVDDNNRAILASHVQFSNGFRMDLDELGARAEGLGTPFIVNATQSLGSFPIDVKKSKISALTASCHKWMGAGYGLSVVYVSKETREKTKWPLMGWLSVAQEDLFSAEDVKIKEITSAIETGVTPLSNYYALGASVDLITEIGVENIATRIQTLSTQFADRLATEGFEILSFRDQESEHSKSHNSGNILIKNEDPEKAWEILNKKGIYLSPRRGGLRVSINYFNNTSDLDQLILALKELG
ncbi:MAG: aminotransferase class V-fold PLP-dependent enzyme [Bacteriovoracaceae bacterium]|jgi:cysteine desulfurase / selenocysteine lyase|nr:aminotransferase class V-fold PLP-dependent enzyme [Bacteriovoracaceae bacterium]